VRAFRPSAYSAVCAFVPFAHSTVGGSGWGHRPRVHATVCVFGRLCIRPLRAFDRGWIRVRSLAARACDRACIPSVHWSPGCIPPYAHSGNVEERPFRAASADNGRTGFSPGLELPSLSNPLRITISREHLHNPNCDFPVELPWNTRAEQANCPTPVEQRGRAGLQPGVRRSIATGFSPRASDRHFLVNTLTITTSR
jgi:hypothetical protein